jgi:GDP-4-dehydro-6-deoxy-D-mannose reductase
VRALVTGGNGFVGTHVVRALRERGAQTIVAGRTHDGSGVDVPLDLSDAQNVFGVVELARPSVIFHLAAQAFVPEATRAPLATYDANALGTARLLEAVRSAGEPFPRVVVASSAEVYGARDASSYPLRETLPPQPATPYAASKLAAEAFALAAWRTYRIPVIVTRGFNAIGPGQDARFVVAAFAAQLARVAAGETHVMLVGNLTAQRDFLDVRDVAAAYLALAEGGEPGEVYNVSSGRAVAIGELLRGLITVARVAVEVREDPERMRPSDMPLAYGDPAKLQAATGWAPRIPLARSLRDAYEDAVARRAGA